MAAAFQPTRVFVKMQAPERPQATCPLMIHAHKRSGVGYRNP